MNFTLSANDANRFTSSQCISRKLDGHRCHASGSDSRHGLPTSSPAPSPSSRKCFQEQFSRAPSSPPKFSFRNLAARRGVLPPSHIPSEYKMVATSNAKRMSFQTKYSTFSARMSSSRRPHPTRASSGRRRSLVRTGRATVLKFCSPPTCCLLQGCSTVKGRWVNRTCVRVCTIIYEHLNCCGMFLTRCFL